MKQLIEAKILESQLYNASLFVSTDNSEYEGIRIKIRQLYEDAAKNGNIEAKAMLAIYLAYCIGGPNDVKLHYSLVNEAAEANEPTALGMRAENYWFGENGFVQNIDNCEIDAKKAHNAGSWLGSTVYSWVLRGKGQVETADKICTESLPLLMNEALNGNSIAQDWLAWRYNNGEGVSRSPEVASAWFRISADNGLGWAQYWLGLRYLNGDGTIKNLEAARYWINKAATKGIKDAIEQLKLIL